MGEVEEGTRKWGRDTLKNDWQSIEPNQKVSVSPPKWTETVLHVISLQSV